MVRILGEGQVGEEFLLVRPAQGEGRLREWPFLKDRPDAQPAVEDLDCRERLV